MDKNMQPGIMIRAIHQVRCAFDKQQGKASKIKNYFAFDYAFELVSENKGQAELTLKAKGTNADDSTEVYNCEIVYIGVFEVVKGSANMPLGEFLGTNAPAHLLPYIRESLSSLSQKAGLPAILLPPINILALLSAKMPKAPDKED
ncbi:MAG: protein-export chaperone SecB [Candidatus Cloacimonetes bacterium]|nr:protein-export chaperone SecB [Candidatus Cloacimonadota bacterium]MDY0172125.1 protein-export chaperone SecB [Candidatus Cloacimonadaceae bacterium]